MIAVIKRLLVGQPHATLTQYNQRLRKNIALAVFSSDSVAHDNLVAISELIAATLPIDHMLMVFVSILSRMLSMTLFAAVGSTPQPSDNRIEIVLACLVLITLVGMQTIKANGTIFELLSVVSIPYRLGA